ncbi:MAG TPA: hypothetical protein VGS41_08670 [Chthonomonadales bacterium]|nr:hypothetical protein [Chthonomonadales bacterium]
MLVRLAACRDQELASACVRALEHVGDEMALEHVRELTESCKVCPAIRSAAREVLPRMRYRLELQSVRDTGLRVCGPGAGNDPTSLVRPASSLSQSSSRMNEPSPKIQTTDSLGY